MILTKKKRNHMMPKGARLPKNKNSTPLIPPPEAMSMEDNTTSVEEMGTNEAYDEGGAHDIGLDQFEMNGTGNENDFAPRQLSPSAFVVLKLKILTRLQKIEYCS